VVVGVGSVVVFKALNPLDGFEMEIRSRQQRFIIKAINDDEALRKIPVIVRRRILLAMNLAVAPR